MAWTEAASRPSQDVHGALRQRFGAGEAEALAEAMRATWAERVGLGITDPATAAMVDVLESVGIAATSAGSGGAVVGLLGDHAAPAGPWDETVVVDPVTHPG